MNVGPAIVPGSAVIRPLHPECVITGWQRGIGHCAVAAVSLLPRGLQRFQPIAIAIARRICKAENGKFEREDILLRLKCQGSGERNGLV